MSDSDADDGPTASQIQAQPLVAACAAGADQSLDRSSKGSNGSGQGSRVNGKAEPKTAGSAAYGSARPLGLTPPCYTLARVLLTGDGGAAPETPEAIEPAPTEAPPLATLGLALLSKTPFCRDSTLPRSCK